MLPEKQKFISDRIKQFYLPGIISDYDSTITIQDLADLFAQVDKVSNIEIKKSLKLLGFSEENRIDNIYLVKRIQI